MTGFDLTQNFTPNAESLLRRVRPRVVPPQILVLKAELVNQAPLASQAMAQKTLHDYSALSANQVPTRPEVNTRAENFEIETGLITMVQASPFRGKANEDFSCHSVCIYPHQSIVSFHPTPKDSLCEAHGR